MDAIERAEQRRDDDFETTRRGLNEAIAHAKGEAKAGDVRILIADEAPDKTCAAIDADLKRN